MAGMLIRFWLRRFLMVLAIACPALVVMERLRHAEIPSYAGAAGWAAAAALVAASVATYWAHKHGCAFPRQRSVSPT